ncbi:hypothetical protein FB451DRAFT_1557191 [Mycena latifolia]|nr:hypothetical protein FB451DRAFT_1557191 [Mycena latifolia]
MAITRSARSSSPTPSENSDMYYDDFKNASPSPAPSQTADQLGWESDGTPAPMDSRDATPIQAARPSSPASVVEISREEFPPLPGPTPATVTKPRATKAAKAKKGKEKAKATETTPAEAAAHNGDDNDPFLAADTAAAIAASLGQQTEHDNTTAGASSSRRPAAAPGSPTKRQRANTAGDTVAPTIVVPVITPLALAPVPTPATTAHAVAPAMATAPAPAPAASATVAPTSAQAAAPVVVPAAVPATIAQHAMAAAPVQPVAAVAPAQPAAAAAQLPLWLTADGLPPRGSYTPTPVGGFDGIVYEPERLLHGVPQELLELYQGVPFPKIFLTVSGGNGAVMRTHGLIREAIGNFINIDATDFILSTPPAAANGTSPPLWLVAGIPAWLTQAILDNRVLSSSAITIYPLPYDMPVLGFVGVFAGFTLPNSDDGARAARDLIRTALRANDEIREFVHTHRSAYGPLVSAGEALDILVDSVIVLGMELIVQDTNTVAWRLHVRTPTEDRAEWGQFRRLCGKLQIITLSGAARLQRPFRCRICPSIDHPTPLCPFPNTPGWLGPTHATIAALEEASRAAAAKAQEMMRPANFDTGASSSRGRNGRGRGGNNSKANRGGGGKRGGDFKGKGRQRDDFF